MAVDTHTHTHTHTKKKKEGTSSAIFCVGIAATCYELKQCADRVRRRPTALGSVRSSDNVSIDWFRFFFRYSYGSQLFC